MTALTTVGVLGLALALTVTVEERRVSAEQSRAAESALAATNLVAERDSTKDVAATNKRVATMLGDTLRLVERQVIQVSQRRDALDRALNTERRARYTLDTTVDSLHRVAAAVAVASLVKTTRLATFEIRQTPYTVSARVEMPEPPDSAHIALRVVLDPIRVEARVACSAANERGIKTASITASSPPWAAIRFDRVEQSPDLCASPALSRAQPGRRLVRFTPLVLGAGRVFGPNGSGVWGWFLGSGIRVGN